MRLPEGALTLAPPQAGRPGDAARRRTVARMSREATVLPRRGRVASFGDAATRADDAGARRNGRGEDGEESRGMIARPGVADFGG